MADGSGSVARSPLRLEPRKETPPPVVFRQGVRPPFAVRWYGVTSLLGHFRNFISRAVASESVDVRDWMRPQDPHVLLRSVARSLTLNPTADGPRTLTEIAGRPIWIDFVADTGDDRDVSAAVGKMVSGVYDVLDPAAGQEITLPRGDLLVLGGDIAYPVATADEIHRRLVQPWNEVFLGLAEDPAPRVLLGVPGNHDWYDGLDGFARLIRRMGVDPTGEPPPPAERPRAIQKLLRLREIRSRKVGFVARELHLDEVGGLLKIVRDAFQVLRAFSRGVTVKRRKRLTLYGYEAVQEASYFALPLAPNLDMWGADRQLGRIDFRQRLYFQKRRRQHRTQGLLLVASDPAIAFGEHTRAGAQVLSGCKVSFQRDCLFYLTGDVHHYERRTMGRSMHVIGGGGGAFLHGSRISPAPLGPADCAYPDARTTRHIVARVPLNLMLGRCGFLTHLVFAMLAVVELGAAHGSKTALVGTSIAITVGLSTVFWLIAGLQRAHPRRVAAVSVPFGAAIGLLPMLLRLALPEVIPALAGDGAVVLVQALLGSFLFGFFLVINAITGLEHEQAFAALSHPGYRHFIRLRVDSTGLVDGWVIGKDDPLAEGPPVLVDHFSWAPKKRAERAAHEPEA